MIDTFDNDILTNECEHETFEASLAGERLDVFCSRMLGCTRSYIKKIIDSELVTVNGKTEKANCKLKQGSTVEIELPPLRSTDIVPENLPINIIYEDSDIAVIDKEKGMVVHPAPGHYTGTLVNAIMYHIKDLSGIGGELRPGIVHRIDKLTSGLLVIAKNDNAHNALSEQLKDHTLGRTYIALVVGNIKDDDGTVDAPIGRHPVDRKRMAITADGRQAVTHYHVLERFNGYTLIEARLETGRTHQIRVHMAHIKHPVVGDEVYGTKNCPFKLDGQMLHAKALRLIHPTTGEAMEFSSQTPEYFLRILDILHNRQN